MLPIKRKSGEEAEGEGDIEFVKSAHSHDETVPLKKPCLISSFASSSSDSPVTVTATNCTDKGEAVADNCGFIMGLGDGKVNGGVSGSSPADIVEDLHSRRHTVYGRETMRRLFASNVLVSGMQGLGAEIAKNLILAGVKSVTLHDEEAART